MAGGTIRALVSSSTVTDPTTVTPTSSPSPLLLGGILGAVGALVVVLIVSIVAIIIVVALRRKQKTRKREIVQRYIVKLLHYYASVCVCVCAVGISPGYKSQCLVSKGLYQMWSTNIMVCSVW